MTYFQPLTVLFLLVAAIGLIRLRHGKKSLLPTLGVLGLLLLSWPPVDWLLARPLEAWYPARPFQAAPTQAIVVLASAVSPPQYERPYPLADRMTYERCEYAAWLYKRWQAIPVLACGGRTGRGEPVAVTMHELLKRAGVPESVIWMETRSSSTYEHAVFGAEILRKHGVGSIALVVEAQSMPRAAACFRKQGIAVTPAPCAYRSLQSSFEEFVPTWKAIGRNEDTLHEMVGLAWYWLRGWI